MKKLSMTIYELREVSRNEIEQFAVAVSDGDNIDVKNGLVLYNEYIEWNECSNDLNFQEIIDSYLKINHVKDYVLLRVFDGDICHVELEEPPVFKPIILDEGLTLPEMKEEKLVINRDSTKEDIIRFLESQFIQTKDKEDKRQEVLALVQKQGERVSGTLIQIVINNFGDVTFL